MSDIRESPSGNPGFIEDPREPWMNIQAPSASAPSPPPTPSYSMAPTGLPQPPPPQGYSGYPTGPSPYGVASSKKNWLGVVSLVLGVLGGGVLGIILGVLGLNAVKRGEANNRGIALAGVIVNASVLAIFALIIVIAGVLSAVGPERTDLLKLGHCFDEPELYMEDGIEVVGEYTVVPCDEPHYGEVYYVGSITDASYPGADVVDTRVDEECFAQGEFWLDLDNPDVQYYSYYYPTALGFSSGQRSYECYVYADYPIEGSVRLNP